MWTHRWLTNKIRSDGTMVPRSVNLYYYMEQILAFIIRKSTGATYALIWNMYILDSIIIYNYIINNRSIETLKNLSLERRNLVYMRVGVISRVLVIVGRDQKFWSVQNTAWGGVEDSERTENIEVLDLKMHFITFYKCISRAHHSPYTLIRHCTEVFMHIISNTCNGYLW